MLVSVAVGVLAPSLLIFVLRFADTPTSAFMIAQQLRGWHQERPRPWVHHEWLSWDDMPPRLALAVVVAEDQRFIEHAGFDWIEVRVALRERGRSGRGRGASTITQQTAKNLFLWPGRSWLRKAIEAALTVLLEALWPKQRVLETYLNIAQFGPRIYGVSAAARAHFGVEPSALTDQEMALLAAMLPAPNRFDPARPSSNLKRRAARVRAGMRRLGLAHIKAILPAD